MHGHRLKIKSPLNYLDMTSIVDRDMATFLGRQCYFALPSVSQSTLTLYNKILFKIIIHHYVYFTANFNILVVLKFKLQKTHISTNEKCIIYIFIILQRT